MHLFNGNQGKGEKGFTLIELLVVIGILAVIPDSEEHPLATSGRCPDALLRWIRA